MENQIAHTVGWEQSESIKEIAISLSKTQDALKPVTASKTNPFFKSKYADLVDCWNSCRMQLAINGLSVVQGFEPCGAGSIVVVTQLLHISGEWMRSRLQVPLAKNDPQGVGSAITYARRYSLSAMVGLSAQDEDDDGNRASAPKTSTQPRNTQQSQATSTPQKASNPPHQQSSLGPDQDIKVY